MSDATPLHICILNMSGAHWLGGHHYYQNIIRALAMLPDAEREFRVTYAVGGTVDPTLVETLGRYCSLVSIDHVLNPDPRLPARARRLVRRRLGLLNPQLHDWLVAQHVDFAYPCVTGGEAAGHYRTAHWIADLQFKHFPQFQLPATLTAQERYLGDIARTARTIVLSSKFGEADCLAHYPETAGRTFVMPFRVVTDPPKADAVPVDAPARYHLPRRFFLVSNQFWQNKDHRTLFEAMGLLRARGIDAELVCTGHFYDPRLPSYTDELLGTLHELGVAKRVHILGAIPRAHQLDLLRRAVAVLQPSRFEGWNTSIEEARLIGRPVIASAIPVHREQHWPGMALFEPGDATELADQLAEAWTMPLDGTLDLAREEAARADYLPLVQDFARRFLELARGEAE